jgi:nucleotide-binding universal stress UspA family protein
VARIDEEKMAAAGELLAPALQSVPKGVEVQLEIASGRPVEAILRAREAYEIDVILTGVPIRSVLEETLFGSTSRELSRLTATPLMIFRPQLISTYTNEELALRCQHLWRYLLIPYNGSPAARYLIERLQEQLRRQPSDSPQQCLLLWVVDDGGRREVLTTHRLQEAREKLQVLQGELTAEFDLEVEIEVRHGNPLHEIVEVAVEQDITAIAIASDGSGNLLEWTVGSVTSEVLHRCWFPILAFSKA